MKDVKGKVAVVTGAASGIGRGLADRFAAEGCRVVIADVEQGALDAAEREMRAAGADVIAVRTDVSKAAAVQALADKTMAHFGGVNIVCNNAGVGGAGGLSWDASLEDWEWTVGVNLWGVINGVRSFVPLMLKSGEEGHVVNTASVAGLMPGAGGAAYTTTKFGVVGLSEALYWELMYTSNGKVGVSVLCPGAVDTNIVDSGRNRPGGPPPMPAPGTPEAMGLEMIREVLKAGMSPKELAGIVLNGIVENRFYILPHPEHNGVVKKRAEVLSTVGGPPPAIGTA